MGVSVIVASYNCGKYIRECLDSIDRQDYKGEIEVLVCDDCSSDNSAEILREYAERGKILLLQNRVNIGAAPSRNRCIELAKYDYVAILDADDYIAPERFRIQSKVLDDNPKVDFVATGIRRFYENGEVRDTMTTLKYPQPNDFLKSLPFSHATTMFRKSCLEAVGGYRVSKETKRGHDYDLFMRLYAAGYRGMNIPDILYFYRCFTTSGSRDKYRHRINEAVVRYKGFKAMHLGIKAVPYVVKPLIVGLLPKKMLLRLQKSRLR